MIFKKARDWLKAASRTSFDKVIYEAKITPRQMEIAKMRFLQGKLNYQIAAELNISVKTVERDAKAAYKAVNKILDTMI